MIKTLLVVGALFGISYFAKAPAVEQPVAPYQDLLALKPLYKEPIGDPYFIWSAEDQQCMALNIFYEAGVESHEGKLAVGTVTLNRLATGRWGSTVCDVVWAPKQFSWTIQVSKNDPEPKGELWEASKNAASEVLNGYLVPELEGSLHYHANYVNPRWARQKTELAVIGTHIFYYR